MVYSATHITRHIYQSAVAQCINELRLKPRSMPGQRVLESRIWVQPEPSAVLERRDYFGNDVMTISVCEPHDRLTIEATSTVEVQGQTVEELPSLTWEEACELLGRRADAGCCEALEFVFDSPFVSQGEDLAEFARPTFTAGRPLIEGLKELAHRIHTEFEYRPKSTSIDMPLLEVLRNRQGVCQDFAHVMIGALRSLRIPARYVSGYLRSSPTNLGSEASHAWVSVFVPGAGWLSFDPTNDVMPTDGHITLAWGRDYGDVTPVKGITVGGGRQVVEVEVRVQAAEGR